MICKRGGFSDRNKIKPENEELQLLDFDSRTRIHLYNFLSNEFVQTYNTNQFVLDPDVQKFFRFILGEVYNQIVDATRRYTSKEFWNLIKVTIETSSYHEVLTLIEAIAQHWDEYCKDFREDLYYIDSIGYTSTSIYEKFNGFLKKEYVGYRFLGNIIVPISDEIELNAINEVISRSDDIVREHLLKAASLLSDRENPDYENSIKESISAVEALCEIKTGVRGKEATLGKMLKQLEDGGIDIHPSLKTAFDKLYGYTCDAKGIRHAGDIDGPGASFEEAKFMLVSCSAFINYLTALSADKKNLFL